MVDSDSSACSMALSLLTALMCWPALRQRAGAFSRAASRIGPSRWVDDGGTGEVDISGGAADVPEGPPIDPAPPPPMPVAVEATDQVLWLM